MSQARGRGKVLPRRVPSRASAQQQLQQHVHPTESLQVISVHASAAEAPLSQISVAPVSGTPDIGWRCADFVVANSRPVQALAVSQLASVAARQHLSSGQPVLLKQLQLATCTLNKGTRRPATQEGQQLGQAELQLPVLCSPAASNRFIEAEASKNAPGSYYYVRKPETSVMQMSFVEWLSCWQNWTNNMLLLKVRRPEGLADCCHNSCLAYSRHPATLPSVLPFGMHEQH